MEKFQKTDPPKCGHSVSKSIFGILKIKKLTPKTTLWNYQKSKLCTRRGEMEKFQKKDPPKRWYSVSKTAFGILEIKKNTPKTTFWKYPKSKQYIRRGEMVPYCRQDRHLTVFLPSGQTGYDIRMKWGGKIFPTPGLELGPPARRHCRRYICRTSNAPYGFVVSQRPRGNGRTDPCFYRESIDS